MCWFNNILKRKDQIILKGSVKIPRSNNTKGKYLKYIKWLILMIILMKI